VRVNNRSRRRAVAACALALLGLTACHDPGSGTGFPGTTSGSGPGNAATAPELEPTGNLAAPPPATIAKPPPLPTGATVSVPSSIAANCSADVTDALQSWIASVPDNSTIAFGKNACYRLDGTVIVEDRARLLLEGNGATLRANGTGNRERGQLVLRGGHDLTVRDLVVRGVNPHAGATAAAYVADLEAQHAFAVHGATNVLLEHVQAYDTYGDFVYIGPEGPTPSHDVTVANSVLERSGRQGISITGAIGVTITGNVISGSARSMFDIETNLRTQPVRDVHIVGNVTGAAVNFWIANKGSNSDIGDFVVSGNRMAAPTGGLVFVFARRGTPRGPFEFIDNQLSTTGAVNDEGSSGAFYFALTDNVTLRGNTVQLPAGRNMPAVELHDVHHVDVSGNHFDGAGRAIITDAQSGDIHGP
jgi:hypothetical protein